MNRHCYPFVAAAVAAALSVPLTPAWSGDLVGRVTDASTGRPLPNATVRIPQLGRTTTADRSGAYRFSDVPGGTHSVEVEYVGFSTTRNDVTVPETGEVAQAFAVGAANAELGLEEVTVTGYRLAQITALQDKKSSQTIKESVTADDAGKLPDQNAGETLARVTGVAVSTDQGEGRYVTIRGIDAALSNVTIDGQLIGSPEGDTRRVALDTVPANILSKLEVVKAATPDLDGNAIGGTINLVTPSVFDDPDGRFFSATADYGYYDLGGQNPWGGSIGWGNTFNDRFGILLSASYSDREFNSHNLQGGDPWEEEGDYLVPDEMGLRDYLIRRVRKGFVANFEFRPNDDVRLHWRNLYNRYEDTEQQPEVVYDYRNGDLEDQTPTSGTFTEGEGERLNTKRYEIQSILSSSLGGEFDIGD
ncbi:MAG: carboxypeptidase regulatory-like domain-containing protein, partial [Steroidobacter sp.]